MTVKILHAEMRKSVMRNITFLSLPLKPRLILAASAREQFTFKILHSKKFQL